MSYPLTELVLTGVWALKKAQEKKLENATMDVRSYEAGQDQTWKNKMDN